MIYSEILFY